MAKEEVLYASEICGHCKAALALANDPKYAPHIRIVFVNQTDGYELMKAASVFQAPTLVTRMGEKISGGKTMAEYLSATYGA